MRPTKAHFLRMNAQSREQTAEAKSERFAPYEQMLLLLNRHKKDLKNIQSMEKKAEFKKNILKDYEPWLEGVLANPQPKQDDVFMQWLPWGLDCNANQLALLIAEHALKHDLTLPEAFSRDVATFIAEEMANKANTYSKTGKIFKIEYLEKTKSLIEEKDIPDEARAKLLKEIANLKAKSESKEEQNEALELYKRSLELNSKIGVTAEIKRLQKVINQE